LELVTSVKSQYTVEDVQISGKGGTKSSAAELTQFRAQMQQGLGAAQTLTGKTFFRVQGRAADGTTTLLASTALSLPGQPAMTIRLTQTVAPDGAAQITRAESDNPQLQAVLSTLSPEALKVQFSKGSDLSEVYGQPLTVGQPRTRIGTLDGQALMGGLAASMGSAAALGKIKASPLTVQSTTTYQGVNAAGQYVFNLRSTAQPWSLSLDGLGSESGLVSMNMELLDLAQSGQSLYRRDGLPVAQTLTQTIRMRMTTQTADIGQIQVVLRMTQTITATSR